MLSIDQSPLPQNPNRQTSAPAPIESQLSKQLPAPVDRIEPIQKALPTYQITHTRSYSPETCRVNMPMKKMLEYLNTPAGQQWVEWMCQGLESNQPLFMPCMAETNGKMQDILSESLALPGLSDDDRRGLQTFMKKLRQNNDDGYPYEQSERLALCFAKIRSYLLVKYGAEVCQTKEQKSKHQRMKAMMEKEHSRLSIQTILALPWDVMTSAKSPTISAAMEVCREILKTGIDMAEQFILPYAMGSFYKALKIVSFDPLTIWDFNSTYGQNIILLGLLDGFLARHDAREFSPFEFILHDGTHSSYKNNMIDVHAKNYFPRSETPGKNEKLLLALIKAAIEGFEQSKPQLTDEEYTLCSLLLFHYTHELNYLSYEMINPDRFADKTSDRLNESLKCIEEDLKEGGKYDGGPTCQITEKFRKSLAAKDSVIPLFTYFLNELRESFNENRPFAFKPESILSRL